MGYIATYTYIFSIISYLANKLGKLSCGWIAWLSKMCKCTCCSCAHFLLDIIMLRCEMKLLLFSTSSMWKSEKSRQGVFLKFQKNTIMYISKHRLQVNRICNRRGKWCFNGEEEKVRAGTNNSSWKQKLSNYNVQKIAAVSNQLYIYIYMITSLSVKTSQRSEEKKKTNQSSSSSLLYQWLPSWTWIWHCFFCFLHGFSWVTLNRWASTPLFKEVHQGVLLQCHAYRNFFHVKNTWSRRSPCRPRSRAVCHWRRCSPMMSTASAVFSTILRFSSRSTLPRMMPWSFQRPAVPMPTYHYAKKVLQIYFPLREIRFLLIPEYIFSFCIFFLITRILEKIKNYFFRD